MAGSQIGVITLSLLLVLLTPRSCVGRVFIVGDSGGWVERPYDKSFNDWAQRQRFHVNDTLEFEYNKQADGVLLVNEAQYNACDTSSQPLLRLDGGVYRFVLDKPGPYYFIDVNSYRCRLGERLKVIVESWHNSTSSSPVAPPPTQPPPPTKSAPSPKPTSSSAPPFPSPTNVLSPSIATVPATSGTFPPSKSSAVALSTGVLACLIVGGAAFL